MKVIFYASVKGGSERCLQRNVAALVPGKNKVFYRTIGGLGRTLRQFTYERPVAVLLAASTEELIDLLAIRDLLENLRIILIVPDRKKTTIAMGHTLRPRFLGYTDGNFKDVAAVLYKMIRKELNTEWQNQQKQ